MSGNFAIKGGEGGGRTPNGKCHLKFPFWFFDYLPILVICKMQPPKQDLIIKLGALSPQVRVRQVFRPWLRWHKLQSSSDHSWKGKNGRRGHLLLHCCWTFEARTWRKPLPLSRRVHPGLPQRSEALKNRRVQPWIHLFIPYDTARTWRGSLSQVRFPL